MPTNQLLTIGDVWQPNQGNNLINLINMRQNMQDSRFRNRLNAIQVGNAEFAKQQQDAIVASYGGPDAYAAAQAQRQRDLAKQELQTKAQTQLKTAAETLTSLKKAFGLEGIKNNWDEIRKLHPLFKMMSPDGIKEDEYIIKNDVGTILGRWITNPEGGSPFFLPEPKKPVGSTETNYRLGLEARLREEHPDWPSAKVQFEAAKQIREENAASSTSGSTETFYRKGIEEQLRSEHGPESKDPWTEDKVRFEAAKRVRDENLASSKQKIEFTANLREEGKVAAEERAIDKSFKGFAPEEKELLFWKNFITGKDPKFAWGDRNSYTQFGREKAAWMIDKFGDPDAPDKGVRKAAAYETRIQADYKSQDRSVGNQRKIYDMMNGFVLNLNQQVDKVSKLLKEADRVGLKIVNIPIVELKTKIIGSGLEANIKSYLLEISNEIGKLSTGSAASIRELGENAQIKWEKIHDTTLPVGELLKVLNTTKDQANMRITAAKEAMDMTRHAIESLGEDGGAPVFPAKNEEILPGVTKSAVQAELLRRKGAK